jgi:hypothetical protein
MGLLVPHLCRIFRASMAHGFIPKARGKLKWHLIQSLGNLITLRPRLVVLSDCHLSSWKRWRN